MADDKNQPTEKAVAKREATPIYLSDMAPKGVDGRVWARVLKEQLLSQRSDGTEPPDTDLLFFAQVSKSTGLDPSKREIYGIYRSVKQRDGGYKPRLTIQTSIDGFRVTAGRSGQFGGSKEPEFIYDPDLSITIKRSDIIKKAPNTAKVTVMKMMNNRIIETTRTANWLDYYPGSTPDGNMWRKFPEVMLAKCAEAQALRAAFPNCENLYLEEEMQKPEDSEITNDDMNKVADAIRNAKDFDELLSIVDGLPVDQQRQVTTLADKRAKELSEAEDSGTTKN